MRWLAPLALLFVVGCGSSASAHFTVKSRFVGTSLEQAVIVPSGDTQGRPLLVLLHGRSSSPDSMARKSMANAAAATGWGSYVLREVIPAAIRKYDLDPGRVAIGGFSMGGFGALDLARFRRFCAVGGHSAAMWRTGGETPAGAFDDAEDFERNDVIGLARAHPGIYRGARVWLDVGTEDPFRSADTELAGLLPDARFRLWHGGHEISYFDDHALEILRFYANALRDC